MSQGFVFKITVVGDGAVGKTSLIQRFTEGEFNEEYIMTLGAQFTKFTEEVDGVPCELFIWDIAGQDTFKKLRQSFYKGSKAAIIVFSHEDNKHGEESFKNIGTWYDDITKNAKGIPIVLFGNKIDLIDRESLNKSDKTSSNSNVDNLKKKYTFDGYYLTSALTGEGVTDAFRELIRKLYDKFKQNI